MEEEKDAPTTTEDTALVTAEAPEPCTECLEITLPQRECPDCHHDVQPIELRGDTFWKCKQCGEEWDGGAAYGFACPEHGGLIPPELAEKRGNNSLPMYKKDYRKSGIAYYY